MPPSDGKLSVFAIAGLAEEAVWLLGHTYVAAPTGKTLHARADITTRVVAEVGLQMDPDNIPPRDANVIGWPAGKSEQKLKAEMLAEAAILRLPPSTAQPGLEGVEERLIR
jgi:hypothetical protein